MTPRLVHADDVPPQPWRNGGGRTRELLCEPAGEHWRLRISLADIDADGPFSAFDGVERWFAVVEGAGVELRFSDRTQHVTPASMPLRFDGATAPGCTLIDGPTRDLNLMQRGGRAAMAPVRDGIEWRGDLAQRGLFVRVPGTLHDGSDAMHLPARTLAWGLGGAGHRFVADAVPGDGGPPGWWLAHDTEAA